MNQAIERRARDTAGKPDAVRTNLCHVDRVRDLGPLVLGLAAMVVMASNPCCTPAATHQDRYYAHDAVEDVHGVIAPWYQGQNGQLDLRVQVSAEFLKRYPWVGADESVMAGPHWVFNPRVDLADDGTIQVLPATPHMNGNLGQRFKYITEALPRYYRYSGDPAVLGLLKIAADYLLTYYQTPADHSWPQFPVSVPLHGTPYGAVAPGGYIQLDLSAGIGLGMLRVYQLTGDEKYLAAARRWGDLFAERCDRRPGARPWGRYANPEDVAWGALPDGNVLTGGVANILIFLDELIALGYIGESGAIIAARDAGRTYLRDKLLPAWQQNDTWGRHYWDWEHPVQGILPTGWVVQYLMDHPDVFPDWNVDVRNLLGLYLNRACVSPDSNGDVYSGAWAYPEGCACCGRSLDFCPLFLARYWARYGVEADNAWAREIARRKSILSTYHFHELGKVEDNIDGGQITAANWSELIGFGPILCALEMIGWMPEEFGPARENHLVRTTALVTSIVYGQGHIAYRTFAAPPRSIDVLRLAFLPDSITADGHSLALRSDLESNGYTCRPLECGDWIVHVRHDGATALVITGPDPQATVDDGDLQFSGTWVHADDSSSIGGSLSSATDAPACATCRFHGNQVRVIGRVDPQGGRADVLLDGQRQPTVIDCWTPGVARHQQVLFYRSGLGNGPHELTVVARGAKNAHAQGTAVYVDAVQVSAAEATPTSGSGGGPTTAQRMIFGYPRREAYVDSAGHTWLPATEFVVRSGHGTDSLAQAWWTEPAAAPVTGTDDPELYRYGAHAHDFWVNLTVGPGTYQVRLKLAETRDQRHLTMVRINGQTVDANVDVAERAGGHSKALDLVYHGIRPRSGIIEVRFAGTGDQEAMVQALELLPD